MGQAEVGTDIDGLATGVRYHSQLVGGHCVPLLWIRVHQWCGEKRASWHTLLCSRPAHTE